MHPVQVQYAPSHVQSCGRDTAHDLHPKANMAKGVATCFPEFGAWLYNLLNRM